MSDMNNNEERLRILRMVEEDKITAEEAIILLNAIGRSKPAPTPTPVVAHQSEASRSDVPQPSSSGGKWRFFRVRVTDTRSNRPKALVTIPIGLMEWGLKIGAQFSPEVSKINMEDFNQLLQSGIDGKLVDVLDEEDGEHVEVFVE
jgi:hypothetical protein